MSHKVPRQRRFFYGWVIVGVVAISMLNIYGIRHSFPVFFASILEEFGWTRGSTAFMLSLNLLLYGLLAPVSGSLADRWRPKLVMSLGVLLLALSTVGCALAQELWHFYLFFGILPSVGTAFAGAPVLIPAIVNWFRREKGMAIGISYAGGGMSFSMAMYASFLISWVGWRWAYVIIAGTLLGIVVPLVLFFFRYRPKSSEVQANNVSAVELAANRHSVDEVTVASSAFWHLDWTQILRNYRLWLLVLAQASYMGMANFMVIAHQVVYAEDLGYRSAFAASVAGMVGIFVALGNLSGFIADRLGREKSVTLGATLQSLSIVILLLQRDASHPWALYLYAASFGLGMGLTAPGITAGAADLFHGRHFGMVNGLMLMGMGFAGIIGPWLGGYIFDITGSYTIAFIIVIAAYMTACLSIWLAAPRKAGMMPKLSTTS